MRCDCQFAEESSSDDEGDVDGVTEAKGKDETAEDRL